MLFRRVQIINILLVVIFIFSGCTRRSDVMIASRQEKTTTARKSSSKDSIYVYICGEVKHPGVYKFSKDDRIVVAIKASGGLTSKASAESINQAEKMKDGQQITIPSKKQVTKKETTDVNATQSSSGKININTASVEELKTLSGIGESKANDIISYREEHGSFTSPEDIMKIQGIKEGIYNKIKDKITI